MSLTAVFFHAVESNEKTQPHNSMIKSHAILLADYF